MDILQTPSGIRFGLLGKKSSSAAPTLFTFASDIESALGGLEYIRTGIIVGRHGYLCASLDLPYHGAAAVQGHPDGLAGWAAGVSKGEAVFPEFVSKVSQVLDYLIRQGYTDPQKVAVAGISRGAFAAMHVAAADPRFRCAIGFSPVTDLIELGEFAELKNNQLARSLSLTEIAEKLAGRPLWVSIGNNDARVGTDKAIEFTRKVIAASVAQKKPTSSEVIDVELHVMPWPGHGRPVSAHDAAAAWLLARMGEGVTRRQEHRLWEQSGMLSSLEGPCHSRAACRSRVGGNPEPATRFDVA